MASRALLVTGSPRSGTTFLGRMLALPRSVSYLDEPFNLQMGIVGVDRQFRRSAPGTDDPALDRLVGDLLRGRATFKPSPWHAAQRPAAVLGRRLFGSRANLQYRLAARSPWVRTWLLKDPTACFLTERLHRDAGVPAVVIVRHPVAVVASCRRLGWDFEALPRVVEEARAAGEDVPPWRDGLDLVEHNALLWRAVYGHLSGVLDRNPAVVAVRHEDLSAAPVEVLRGLYDRCGLRWTARVEAAVRAHTAPDNPRSVDAAHVLRRDSAALAATAAGALDPVDRERVRDVVGDVAERWYPATDWSLPAGVT